MPFIAPFELGAERVPLLQQPNMTSVEVVFINRVVREFCNKRGGQFYRAPEIGNITIKVIDGFIPCNIGSPKQYRAAAEKGFYVIFQCPETRPYLMSDFAFATKPRERCG